MTDLEAIEIRQSRRAYENKILQLEEINQLQSCIEKINGKTGLHIQLIEDGRDAFAGLSKSYGLFKGVNTLIALVGPKEHPFIKETLGYYGEKLVLEATKVQLSTCWVGGTFSRRSKVFELEQEEILAGVICVGHALEELTLKEKMVRKVMHRKSKTVDEMSVTEGEVPSWFYDGMDAVQKAPSARNLQPVLFEYKNSLVKAHIQDEESFQSLDLGIAKLHFEIGAHGKFSFGNHEVFIKEDS